jgi:hypothetical protein
MDPAAADLQALLATDNPLGGIEQDGLVEV